MAVERYLRKLEKHELRSEVDSVQGNINFLRFLIAKARLAAKTEYQQMLNYDRPKNMWGDHSFPALKELDRVHVKWCRTRRQYHLDKIKAIKSAITYEMIRRKRRLDLF